ncbi:MAG: hypothetical protein WC821_00665 [archaeon]|jgi:CheY-like chemotaxis protein
MEQVHVLYVDDQVKEYVKPIQKICDALGYKLQTAGSIKEALTKTEKQKYNMVICDLSMGTNEVMSPLKFLDMCEKKYNSHPLIFSLYKLDRTEVAGIPFSSKIDLMWLWEKMKNVTEHPWSTRHNPVKITTAQEAITHFLPGGRKKAQRVVNKLSHNTAELKRFLQGVRKQTRTQLIKKISDSTQRMNKLGEMPLPGTIFHALDKREDRMTKGLKPLKRRR